MQIPQRFHAGLADGSITVAFRRWRKPAARAGGRQRTPIGELAIDTVDPVDVKAITEVDARAAGYRDRAELIGELAATATRTARSTASPCIWRAPTRGSPSASTPR